MDIVANLESLQQAIITRATRLIKEYPIENDTNHLEQCSRDNLLCYAILRGFDIHQLQMALDADGLSSLEHVEGHVLHSLQQVLKHVKGAVLDTELCIPTHADAKKMVEERSNRLFGLPRRGRHTRIMVTLDPSYLEQEGVLENLLLNGMDIARINCAHHNREDWQKMIEGLRIAEARLAASNRGMNRKCKIVMDIGGPKIRTGSKELDVQPMKISVPDNESVEGFIDGKALYTLQTGILDANSEASAEASAETNSESNSELSAKTKEEDFSFVLAVNHDSKLQTLEQGDILVFQDARGKKRRLHIMEKINDHRLKVELKKTAIIHNGTILKNKNGTELQIRSIRPQPVIVRCKAGDSIFLYRDPERLGHGAKNGKPIGISCTAPKALDYVQVGERVYIDDGKISCIIKEIHSEYVALEVITPEGRSVRIKEHKGLNFPDSKMTVPALTRIDRRDLEFIVKHADAINYSFVHTPQDIFDLRRSLMELDAPDMGIIAKIETKEAIYNLTKILVAGLGLPSFGVMVARGDLAVDVGFEALPFVQEDILDLCQAAHVPVVLATQYMENLTKKGMPARGEMIDAALAQRAECIMLNKGKHIAGAVETLGHVLASQELRHSKKHQIYKRFTRQNGIFD